MKEKHGNLEDFFLEASRRQNKHQDPTQVLSTYPYKQNKTHKIPIL